MKTWIYDPRRLLRVLADKKERIFLIPTVHSEF